MKKIVLLCAAGMSTSLLVTKMVLAAEKHNLDYDISAYSISNAKESIEGADWYGALWNDWWWSNCKTNFNFVWEIKFYSLSKRLKIRIKGELINGKDN